MIEFNKNTTFNAFKYSTIRLKARYLNLPFYSEAG